MVSACLRQVVRVVFGLSACVVSFAGCGGPIGASGIGHTTISDGSVGTGAEPSPSQLVASSKTIDFGIVPQGGQQREYFELRNLGDGTVDLDRVETSCECLVLTVANHRVVSQSHALATATVDLTRIPTFVGKLAIEIKGTAKDGTVVFSLIATADVRAQAEFHGFDTALSLPGAEGFDLVPTPMATEEKRP